MILIFIYRVTPCFYSYFSPFW